MNDKIDGGDIIIQEEILISESDTFETLYCKVIKITPELFVKAIKLIKNNEMTIIKNEEEHSTYFSFPKKEDILRFKKRGLKII